MIAVRSKTILGIVALLAVALAIPAAQATVPGSPTGAQWVINLTACLTQDPCPEVVFIGPGGGTMDIQSGPSLTTMRADIRPGDLVGVNAPIGLKWHNGWWVVTGVTREQIPASSSRPWLDTPSPPLRLYELWADGTLVKTKVYLEQIFCETCHF